MTSLQLAQKARQLAISNRPARLYKSIIKELPRVMMIYDLVHLGEKEAKKAIRSHFYEHANVKDQRVIDMLVEKGYIDLEDTLLQHKQKTHLMYLLEGQIGTHQNIKVLSADASDDEKFVRWVD